MNLSLDQQIDAAHNEEERIEADALQIEARIVKAGGIPPRRQYGKPVNSEAIRENLGLECCNLGVFIFCILVEYPNGISLIDFAPLLLTSRSFCLGRHCGTNAEAVTAMTERSLFI